MIKVSLGTLLLRFPRSSTAFEQVAEFFDATNMAADRLETDLRMRKFHAGWAYHQVGRSKVGLLVVLSRCVCDNII